MIHPAALLLLRASFTRESLPGPEKGPTWVLRLVWILPQGFPKHGYGSFTLEAVYDEISSII